MGREATCREQEKSIFAGRELTFEFSDPRFLDKNEAFMRWLETCQKQGGIAIVYIDERDEYLLGTTDPDASFHYALLGATNHYPPRYDENNDGYTNVAREVIPLPIFAHTVGLAERNGESDYQLTCSFEDIIELLNDAFGGRIFFASRNLWDSKYNPYTRRGPLPERYVLTMLFGAPEACPANIELLIYLGMDPRDINDLGILKLLAEIRKTSYERLGPTELISEDEILMMMKMTVGAAKLGFPKPPRTTEELIRWWED